MAWGNWFYTMYKMHKMEPGAEVCVHDQWTAPDGWKFELLKDRLWITSPLDLDGPEPTVVLQTGVIKVGATQVWAHWDGPETVWPGVPTFVTVGYHAETETGFCGWTMFRDGSVLPHDPFGISMVRLHLRHWAVAEMMIPDPLPREVAVYWLRELARQEQLGPLWENVEDWFLRGEEIK